MTWSDQVTAYAAIYAAIVATAALALEVRRWFESGPRLSLTLIPEAKVYGGIVDDKNVYLHARVTNRGSMQTTITNFGLHEYKSIFHRWTMRAKKSAIVPVPKNAQPLPYLLLPGTEWAGSTIYNEELRSWAESGKLFVAIYHSYSNYPIQRKVRLTSENNNKKD
jgi:hypothetical protein